MRRVITMMVLISSLGFSLVFADTVVLKSGKKVEGKITERKTDLIMVDVEGVGVPYFLDEIAEINGEKMIPAAPIVVPAQQTQPTQPAKPVALTADAPQSSVFPKASLEDTDSVKINAQEKAMLTIAGIIIGVLLIVYVYSSLCLFMVAKKLMKEPAWLAWVPIGNLVLTCKLANISYWWLSLILASILPYVGFLAAVVFSGFAWWHISQARGKPAWLGILTVIPLVNLVILGYLAFSE